MMEAFSFITSYPCTSKVGGVMSSEVYNFWSATVNDVSILCHIQYTFYSSTNG